MPDFRVALISNIYYQEPELYTKYKSTVAISGESLLNPWGSEKSFRSAIQRRKDALVAAAQLRPAPIVGKADTIREAVGRFRAVSGLSGWPINAATVGRHSSYNLFGSRDLPLKKAKTQPNLPAQYQLSSPSEVMSVFQKLQQTTSGASPSR